MPLNIIWIYISCAVLYQQILLEESPFCNCDRSWRVVTCANPGPFFSHLRGGELGWLFYYGKDSQLWWFGVPYHLEVPARPVTLWCLPFTFDITTLSLVDRSGYVLRRGNFLACTGGVKLTLQLQKLSMAGVTDLVVLRARGEGELAVSGLGAIAAVTLQAGEEYIVRARNIIAWEDTVRTTPEPTRARWLQRVWNQGSLRPE